MIMASKKQDRKTSIFELSKVKNCIGRLCSLGHYWSKQSFCVFGTGCDRLSARLKTAQNVLLYPSTYILSRHPHSHPLEWVPQGHRDRQNRQHSKNGQKVHILHKRSSQSAPYKPHRVGTRKHFFGSKSKKTKRFMIFDPKKRGGHFFRHFWHPPPHHPLPQKLKKVGFKLGGSGGVRTKNLLGDAFIGQSNDFTRGETNNSTPWGRVRE